MTVTAAPLKHRAINNQPLIDPGNEGRHGALTPGHKTRQNARNWPKSPIFGQNRRFLTAIQPRRGPAAGLDAPKYLWDETGETGAATSPCGYAHGRSGPVIRVSVQCWVYKGLEALR